MSAPANQNRPVYLVDRPDTLQQCLQDLGRWDILSFDIEFDNNSYGYGVTLCVIQVATPQACYVIDGLAGLDLGGLYTLFESAQIQKLVHAPGEDLRLLHSLQCFPKNLYDTEVVARLLNYEQTSLTVLLRDKLGFGMDKKQQRSNWLRRPLTDAQVQYAADDVIWLHPLKEVLEKEAAVRGLLPFVREEQELLSTTIYSSVVKTDFLKPADLHHLSPREQYLLNDLLRYRDELARNINRPAYQVLPEDVVRGLAAGTLQPANVLEIPDVYPRFKNNGFVGQLQKQLAQARKAADSQNLSSVKQGRPRQTPAQQDSFRHAEDDKETLFVPIKQAIEQRYGAHTATLLFSNKVVNGLLKGAITIQDIKPAYRQAIIREIAASAGLNLDRYEGMPKRE
ncbi:ribonuclease D [Flavisolibacter sp. BT320]|nr:ribonuclease D [Flavisolibacter longurius]